MGLGGVASFFNHATVCYMIIHKIFVIVLENFKPSRSHVNQATEGLWRCQVICDLALQLAHTLTWASSFVPSLCISPPAERSTHFLWKVLFATVCQKKMCHSLLLCTTNYVCPQNSMKTKPACIHDTLHSSHTHKITYFTHKINHMFFTGNSSKRNF